LGGIFDVAQKIKEVKNLERKTTEPKFWADSNEAQKTLKKIKELKDIVEPWEKAHNEIEDISSLYDMAEEENDVDIINEIDTQLINIENEIGHMEFIRKLSGEDDKCSTIFNIHSGAGGTESCDWCDMLFRMYCRWIELKGFNYTIFDSLPGDVTGLKNITLEVQGEFAYGHLKAEVGVHRLVRISPFDSNSRRHTSFASVYAYPILEDTDDFKIDEDEIRIDTYRASGAGGQHINKTDSAVRMTHLPTNIVVQCQNERSQLKNRNVAIMMLKARVRQHFKEQEEKEREEKLADKKKIEWGSQIRSYVMHPYSLVKDHRTNTETSNVQYVLDGNIDMFIESYLLSF
jgi:peptide chain release factor 2